MNNVHTAEDALKMLEELPAGETVMVLGANDTGKSSFVRAASAHLTAAGRTVGVLDCDLGQGEIGPPGTIGVCLIGPERSSHKLSLRDTLPLATDFIGATSPIRHGPDLCAGALRMAETVRRESPDLLLVDTCGFVQGPAARQLKRNLASILQPSRLLAFARGQELQPLLSIYRKLKAPLVYQAAVHPEAGRKTPAMRATSRTARFAAALAGASEITLDWSAVAFVGAWLGLGKPLAPHLVQFISHTIQRPVLHAEELPDGSLYAVVHGERWNVQEISVLERHFRTKTVVLVSVQKFAGLLVGLIDSNSRLLEIGLVKRIDFARGTITVLSRCRYPAAIAQIWMGAIRLRPDGKELGETRSGEI